MSHHKYLDQGQIEQYILFESIPSEPESEDDLETTSHHTSAVSSPGVSYENFIAASDVVLEHDYFQILDYPVVLEEEIEPPMDGILDIPEAIDTSHANNVLMDNLQERVPEQVGGVSPSEIEDQPSPIAEDRFGLQPPATASLPVIEHGLLENPSISKKLKTCHKTKNIKKTTDSSCTQTETIAYSGSQRKKTFRGRQINKAPKFGPVVRPTPTWSQNLENIPTMSGIVEGEVGVSTVISSMTEITPVKLFKSIITDKIVEDIVFQTNLYAQQSGKRYTPTNKNEIEAFLGINVLMGIKRLPSYRDYWSSDIDLNDPFISQIMPVNRFSWLLGNLHLNDNTLLPKKGHPDFDKLYKLRPFLNDVAENIKHNFHPGQVLAVDESMIKFKGKSGLKQYMPKKPIKRGYKLWILADKSGYVWKFEIYTGKVGDTRQYDLGPTVVKRLTEDLVGKHHSIYIDNFFVTYFLMEDLKDSQINACGTVMIDRVNLPTFQVTKDMNRGSSEWFVSNNNVVCIKWIDNKAVHMLSNFHDPQEEATVKRKEKDGNRITVNCPTAVSDYNQNMNCVDKFDQLKSNYEIDRQSQKWWHRIFFYFIDLVVVNAYVMHNCLPMNRFDSKTFRRHVVFGLVGRTFSRAVPLNIDTAPLQNPGRKPQIPREIRHSDSSHQPTRSTRRRCAVCSTKDKQVSTFWMCCVCKVPLCLSKSKTCFQRFHTVV